MKLFFLIYFTTGLFSWLTAMFLLKKRMPNREDLFMLLVCIIIAPIALYKTLETLNEEE